MNIIITEDPPQIKDPPELGILLPLVPGGLDPSNIIPPSTETDIMSKQSMLGKKKRGADISSDVVNDTPSSESSTLEPRRPKMSGKGKPDNEGGALVIPAKTTSQLTTLASSKDPVAPKRRQGKQLPL